MSLWETRRVVEGLNVSNERCSSRTSDLVLGRVRHLRNRSLRFSSIPQVRDRPPFQAPLYGRSAMLNCVRGVPERACLLLILIASFEPSG